MMADDVFTHTEADAGAYERERGEAEDAWLFRPSPDELDFDPRPVGPAAASLDVLIGRVRDGIERARRAVRS